MSKPQRPCIVWFRDDLRLSDHPALHEAAATGAPLVCVYVLDEESPSLQPPGGRPIGAASRWWLSQSLRALQADLAALTMPLVLRRGAAAQVLAELADATQARAIHWNKIAIASHAAVASDVAQAMAARGVAVHRHQGDLLANPSAVRTKDGRGLRVFSPFLRRLRALVGDIAPLPAPKSLTAGPIVAGDSLDDWKLEPSHPDWATGMRATWRAGETAAQDRLHRFLGGGARLYPHEHDRLDSTETSRLSPYLRFGAISPRQVWQAAHFAADHDPALAPAVAKFTSEVAWRDFCRHLLYDVPDLHRRALKPAFDAFPSRDDNESLNAWRHGRTGYPVVDAGMRQVWQTGVMHNRVRMITASFLVKHLLIDWRRGEEWFWDTLIDADPGSNPANWQWVAGCGADAAPYFRIFNPVLQGEKYDPDGAYVRRWVPELSGLGARWIHRPWDAPADALRQAGLTLGETYPVPIIDHAAARARALKAFATLSNR